MAFVCLLSVWMDFSRLQHHHHADSLVPILCSLDRWTPFYWGQAYYGMAVPLLARPISDPLANLLVQAGIHIALGFGAFALLARYLLPDDREWVVPAAIAASLFVAFVDEDIRFNTFGTTQPYAASIAIGLLGLWLIRAGPSGGFAPRAAAAAVLLALAAWINVGAILLIGPLALARLILDTRPARGGWKNAPRGLFGIALLLGWTFASRFIGERLTGTSRPAGFAITGEWLHRELVWMGELWRQLQPHRWEAWAFAAAALGVASLLFPMFRRGASARLVAAGALASAAVIYLLITGLVDWVQMNGFHVRYALPAMLAAGVALGQLAAIPLEALPALQGAFGRIGAGLCVAVAVAISYGLPGAGHVERAFDSPWHPWDVSWTTAAQEVNSSGATHVAGNYWEVWPVVFRSQWLRHRQGNREPVFGLADRSAPTLERARAVALEQTRVAVVHGRNGKLDAAIALLGYASWEIVERRSLIDVWRPLR